MIEWSPQQHAALENVWHWLDHETDRKQVFRLFGFAGTGKTTLALTIAKMARGRALFAAFTGKAAFVMRSKGCGGASTLHSLIYRVREDSGDDEVLFELNPDSALSDAGLLIVDECSMVNSELGSDVLSFGVPVLVLGDPAQLPPVSGGGFFTEAAPDTMLTEIHRQAAGNPIIRVATDIRLGRPLSFGTLRGDGDAAGVSIVRRSEVTRGSVLRADQVLVGRNDTRVSINRKVRTLLRDRGELPAGTDEPVVGDRVICLKNKRDRGLFNGGTWKILEVSDRKPEAKRAGRKDVSFLHLLEDGTDRASHVAVPKPFWMWSGKENDLVLPDTISRRNYDEFDYAYAVTCHKAQGSQWDKVLVMDESKIFDRGPDGEEMARRWRYTAVTRAAEKLILAR